MMKQMMILCAMALALAACGTGFRNDGLQEDLGIPAGETQPLNHDPAGPFGPP